MNWKRRISYETRNKISNAFLVLTLLMFIGGSIYATHFVFFREPKITWHIKKAGTCLSIASSSTDFNLMAEYLTAAYKYVEHESGNIGWWYPTDKSDWDILKADILRLRDRCLDLAQVYMRTDEIPSGTYTQYEVLVTKITGTDIPMISSRLAHLSSLMSTRTKTATVHVILYSSVMIAFVMISIIFSEIDTFLAVMVSALIVCLLGLVYVVFN